eukprot:COSAG05_NODE_702_length_7857_cov_37.135244_3_plen_71_part_00
MSCQCVLGRGSHAVRHHPYAARQPNWYTFSLPVGLALGRPATCSVTAPLGEWEDLYYQSRSTGPGSTSYV